MSLLSMNNASFGCNRCKPVTFTVMGLQLYRVGTSVLLYFLLTHIVDPIARLVELDYSQVHDLAVQNLDRVSSTRETINSLIMVQEGRLAINQNRRLGFLTYVATVF